MEPSSSSAAETCNRHKRQNTDLTAHEKAKRLKTVQVGEELLQCESSSRPPRISVLPDHLQQPITVNELTELLHYAALGKTGGIKHPSWCRLLHQRRIKALNVVIVEGVTQSDFYKHYLALKHLRKNYSTRVTFTPSSTNLASAIFSIKLPESHVQTLNQRHSGNSGLHRALRSHPVIRKFGVQTRGLTAYVLPQDEMIRRHFPVKGLLSKMNLCSQQMKVFVYQQTLPYIEGMPGFEEFVCTESVDCVTDNSPLYGLDCEMCLTSQGYELTRVSLVDCAGNCVLDELVKPPREILNYLTKFSGITAAMLRPITTTLRDVQAKLRTLLPSDAVLVGHALTNDLMALKLIHQHVIDTSLMYRREFGQKFKLKVLAETVLKRHIQTEEEKGHNPIEDAVAALELAQYFIKTGPLQVVELHLEELWGYTIDEDSSDCPPAPTPSLRFADILQTIHRSVAYLGKRSDITLALSNQQWHNSDKEVLASFRRRTKCSFLSVLLFSSISNHLKGCFPTLEHQHQKLCRSLREMCVVYAGPFPAGVSERDVRKLFRSCGPVRKITMLNTAFRAHAEVEFKLLEGAVLALKTLNGLHMQGQPIKVQRPVNESTLDLDLTLDALMDDSSHIYAVKLKPRMAECLTVSEKVNGHTLEAKCSGVTTVNASAKVNGKSLQPANTNSKPCEEKMSEMFNPFGTVERVLLPAKPGKYVRHAYIKFETSEGRHAALSASEELLKRGYLVCPSLTPPHLSSWVAMATTCVGPDDEADKVEDMIHMHNSAQDQEMDLLMTKLDRHLKKLFRSLSDDTLSVVLLPGHTSLRGNLPGLCLMEVKQAL